MKNVSGIEEIVKVINKIESEDKEYANNFKNILIKNPRIYEDEKYIGSLNTIIKINTLEEKLIRLSNHTIKSDVINTESFYQEVNLLCEVHYLLMVALVDFSAMISLNKTVTDIDFKGLYEEKMKYIKKLEKERKIYE